MAVREGHLDTSAAAWSRAPAGAAAQVWEQLSGEDLHEAFESQVLEYDDGATQRFEENGRTVYHKPSAIDLSGFWWVDTNLMCFVAGTGKRGGGASRCMRTIAASWS